MFKLGVKRVVISKYLKKEENKVMTFIAVLINKIVIYVNIQYIYILYTCALYAKIHTI